MLSRRDAIGLMLSLTLGCIATSCLYIAREQQLTIASQRDTVSSSGRSVASPQSSIVTHPLDLLYQHAMPVQTYRLGRKDAQLPRKSSESTNESSNIPPIHVLVAVEALCIDSARFFHDQLMTAFNALEHDIVKWEVIPFGNAIMPTNGSHTLRCQHGAGECDTNTYEQCAVHLYPDPVQHIPYLACLFASLPMGHRDEPFDQKTGLEPCAKEHHLDFRQLKSCHDDPQLAWKLNKEAAKATPKAHDHVPWVEINGLHMEDIDEQKTSLLEEVCKIYRQNGGHTAGCSK